MKIGERVSKEPVKSEDPGESEHLTQTLERTARVSRPPRTAELFLLFENIDFLVLIDNFQCVVSQFLHGHSFLLLTL